MNELHRSPEQMRKLAYERAGGGPSESNYDPDLLATLCDAADEIERLRGELAAMTHRYQRACQDSDDLEQMVTADHASATRDMVNEYWPECSNCGWRDVFHHPECKKDQP